MSPLTSRNSRPPTLRRRDPRIPGTISEYHPQFTLCSPVGKGGTNFNFPPSKVSEVQPGRIWRAVKFALTIICIVKNAAKFAQFYYGSFIIFRRVVWSFDVVDFLTHSFTLKFSEVLCLVVCYKHLYNGISIYQHLITKSTSNPKPLTRYHNPALPIPTTSALTRLFPARETHSTYTRKPPEGAAPARGLLGALGSFERRLWHNRIRDPRVAIKRMLNGCTLEWLLSMNGGTYRVALFSFGGKICTRFRVYVCGLYVELYVRCWVVYVLFGGFLKSGFRARNSFQCWWIILCYVLCTW